MLKLIFILFSLLATPAMADLQLAQTSSHGVSGNYWIVTQQFVSMKTTAGVPVMTIEVVLSFYKDQAAYDAGNKNLETIVLNWTVSDMASYTAMSMADDGVAFLAKTYAHIMTLATVAGWNGNIDFTTATDPNP